MIRKKAAHQSELFTGIPASPAGWWNSHGDHVRTLPEGFRTIGRTENAFRRGKSGEEDLRRRVHPEVNHTERGRNCLEISISRVRSRTEWRRASFIEETTAVIREKVGNKWAICGLSGGVDSTVAAALCTGNGHAADEHLCKIQGCLGKTNSSKLWRCCGSG